MESDSPNCPRGTIHASIFVTTRGRFDEQPDSNRVSSSSALDRDLVELTKRAERREESLEGWVKLIRSFVRSLTKHGSQRKLSVLFVSSGGE